MPPFLRECPVDDVAGEDETRGEHAAPEDPLAAVPGVGEVREAVDRRRLAVANQVAPRDVYKKVG